jgi:hypothetical protein
MYDMGNYREAGMAGEQNRMLDAVKEVLTSSGLEFEKLMDEPAYKIAHRRARESWDIIVFADEELMALSFICPQVLKADPGHPDTLRLINHVNTNILLGKLIYLEEQGTISAVLTLPCGPHGPGREAVRRAMRTLFAIVEHVTPYLRSAMAAREESLPVPLTVPRIDPADIN